MELFNISGFLKLLRPRRGGRWSEDLPPDLSDLVRKLHELGDVFSRELKEHEPRMREKIEDMKKIGDKVREMHRELEKLKVAGYFGVLAWAAVGLFTGGLGLLPAGAAGAAIGGAAGALGGGAAVVASNRDRCLKEKKFLKKVENLGNEFRRIAEPMTKSLEEIKETCQKLEEKLKKVQSEKTQREDQEFEEFLKQVSDLKEKSEETYLSLLIFHLGIFSTFYDCEKVIECLHDIREKLRVFRDY